MKMSEYTILENAFLAAFPFMLNRIMDALPDAELDLHVLARTDFVAERCFSEFISALEDQGVELGDVEVKRGDLLT